MPCISELDCYLAAPSLQLKAIGHVVLLEKRLQRRKGPFLSRASLFQTAQLISQLSELIVVYAEEKLNNLSEL